jgi:hypothetical protein
MGEGGGGRVNSTVGLGTSSYKAVKKVGGRWVCFLFNIVLFVPSQLSSSKLFLGRKNIGGTFGRPCTPLSPQGTPMVRNIPNDNRAS